MFNLDLAVQVLAQIEDVRANPFTKIGHDQQSWAQAYVDEGVLDEVYDAKTEELLGFGSCNTSMCVAGWAATMSNVRLKWEKVDFPDDPDSVPDGAVLLSCDYTQDGVMIQTKAMELLGIERVFSDDLDDDEIDEHPTWDFGLDGPRLFAPDMNLDELYEQVSLLSEIDTEVLTKMVNEEIAAIMADRQAQRDLLASLTSKLDNPRRQEVIKN